MNTEEYLKMASEVRRNVPFGKKNLPLLPFGIFGNKNDIKFQSVDEIAIYGLNSFVRDEIDFYIQLNIDGIKVFDGVTFYNNNFDGMSASRNERAILQHFTNLHIDLYECTETLSRNNIGDQEFMGIKEN